MSKKQEVISLINVEWKCTCGHVSHYDTNNDGEPLEVGNTVIHICPNCRNVEAMTIDFDGLEEE